MQDMIRWCAFAIVGVLLAIEFRSYRPEYAMYIAVALGLLLFSFGVSRLLVLTQMFDTMKGYLKDSREEFHLLFRVLGITYVCEFAAGICKDAGYGTVGEQLEIMGKLSVMFSGIPILLAVMEKLQSFTI